MQRFSQNNEQDIILDYFKNPETVSLLDIGANDGAKFSNSFALIQLGASGVLVEPSKNVFPELVELHEGNDRIACVNVAIGNENGEATFYDSGVEAIHDGAKSLVATMSITDKIKWEKAVDFTETKTRVITFDELMKISPIKKFDFISVDCEGFDLDILQQMNLEELGCKLICLEHNSVPYVKSKMIEYCAKFGLNRIIGENAENVIIGK